MKKNILLTTPDYPPKIGGLSTFTINIQKTLINLGHSVDLFNWENIKAIKEYKVEKDYDFIINIHFMPSHFLNIKKTKQINFFHGSEIFFTSPNFIKRWVKRILQKKMIHSVEGSFLNFFISDYTQKAAINSQLIINAQRDIIFHNCIDTNNETFIKNSLLKDELFFCSISRDTPHKNLKGCVTLCERIQKQTNKQITLYLTSDNYHSDSITIKPIVNISDEKREEVYRKSHYNLLLSLDHSHLGFIEGFGLSCLEAGKYGTPSIVFNTGGLPENVHHHYNGFVLNPDIIKHEIEIPLILDNTRYTKLRSNCYKHTHQSHGLKEYQNLFESIMGVDS